MTTVNNETIIETQTTSKENWETPELSELDINKTESGLDLVGEISYVTGPIQS